MSDGLVLHPRRCWIRLGGHEIEVRPGQTLIGRHETCHIVIDDPLASRRHARFLWELGRLMVEDLGSVNGVLVNGKRIERPTEVTSGDEIKLGNQRIEVVISAVDAQHHRRGVSANTLVGERRLSKEPPSDQEEATAVRDGEALSTLAMVAEKVLQLGRGPEAEKLLTKPLEAIGIKVRHGEVVETETVALAANCAARLAEITKRGIWFDYVVELHANLRVVMPAAVVDRLYNVVRGLEGANVDRFRAYIESLQQVRATLGPGELFLLRRIEGLERLLALK